MGAPQTAREAGGSKADLTIDVLLVRPLEEQAVCAVEEFKQLCIGYDIGWQMQEPEKGASGGRLYVTCD